MQKIWKMNNLRVRANLWGRTKLRKGTDQRRSAASAVRKPQMMKWCTPARLRPLAEGAENMEEKTRQKLYQLEGRAGKEREANTQLVKTRSSVCNLVVFCTRMSAGFVTLVLLRTYLKFLGIFPSSRK